VSSEASARTNDSTPPFRRKNQAAAIHRVLEEHRLARQDQIKAHTFADLNGIDLDSAARMQVLALARQALVEIDKALLRLEDGSYGFCLGCADPIPEERLLAVPYASHCVACA
jgi:DnaK suppressor protein